MNTRVASGSAARWLAASMLVIVASLSLAATVPAEPKILKVSVSGKSLVVTASVPPAWQSVTLESREVADQGAWVPRAVLRAKKLAAKVTFRLPVSFKSHALRVRGERVSSYPLTFFAGKRTFSSRRSSLWRSGLGSGEAYTLSGDGNLAAGSDLPDVSENTRTVEESDIWKLDGDTLYFFNQYRGLQIIDVSDPDAPALRGELSLPAVGEQMYVLDAGHVALLARGGSGYEQSQVLVADVSGEKPRLVSTLTIEGSVLESRLVGTALYVAVQSCLEGTVAGRAEWQWGTSVCSFDLSNPAAAVTRSALWFPGWGNAVMATDRFLFVALQGGADDAAHDVRVVDISAADGTMREACGIVTAGRVGDKFKMNLSGDVFTAISERFGTLAGEEPDAGQDVWLTTLETFSLADAANPEPLGLLQLAPGERLYATRFDGSRAYAVTFQNVDPLWILDLADPAQPAVAGEVEVPGWSTYIHPLGGRLVTVGMDAGRVAVSLFDVSDPATARLLTRVPLGEDASWSEASWNEKALSVFEGEGLILVPFEGWDGGVYASHVQMIDLLDSTLVARGVISRDCQPRRTTLHRSRLLSLSGKELLGIDIADRDQPAVTGVLELSWAVNRVLMSGDYLLQMEESRAWAVTGHSVVRVAAKADPGVILNRVDLGAVPVVGACVSGGHLYLLQNPVRNGFDDGVVVSGAGAREGVGATAPTNLLLTVMDLAALPDLRAVAQVGISANGGVSGEYEAVWPAQDLLVWVSRTSGYWAMPMAEGAFDGSNPATAAGVSDASVADEIGGVGLWRWPWWGVGGVRLLAVNTADPAHPELVSQYRYAPSLAWGFSAPFVAQGRVYFSHEQSESLPVYGRFGRYYSEWRVRELVDVIDYADPSLPTARPSVGIPGQLVGLSPDGALLYVLGAGPAHVDVTGDAAEALFACAYDGVSAYQVSSLALPKAWPRPVRVDAGRVFLGRAAANGKGAHGVEAWRLSSAGRFVLEASAALEEPASEIACFGALLALQDTRGGVALYDASDPALLTPCGEREAAGGAWADLSRACGSPSDGIWIPLDDFGLVAVPVQ